MNDFYTEQLVKRKTTGKVMLAKAGLIILTLVSLILLLKTPFALILTMVLIALDIFLFRNMDLEYEYLFVNGELDVDKIIARSKRKKVFSANVEELELLAPTGSSELRLVQAEKTYNYSSIAEGRKTYELIVSQKGQKIKVIFEPNDTILNGFKTLAPRKVII